MKRLFKHKAARRSTTTSLEGSTNIPTSGFTFINNSQGASASIIELSNALDDVLGDIEFEGEASDFAKAEIGRLDSEASKYSNSRFLAGVEHPIWSCRSEHRPILIAAAKCSAAIYQPKDPWILEDDVFKYERLRYIEPTRLGTVKATAFYEARQLNPMDSQQRGIFIVAIRGSATKVDHMVNLNNEATEIEDFIPLEMLKESSERFVLPQVHSGFLMAAKALAPHVAQQLEKCTSDNGPKEILFTGHSAGAAVSSLLFYHFLSTASSKHSSLALKCITFGSPPFCNTEFASLTNQTQIKTEDRHLHLNFLNEFDVVPRLDKLYVLSLVDLYRSKFGLPPENTDNDIHDSVPHGYESSDKIGASKTWPLHAPVFVHPGNTILLSLEDAAKDKSGALRLRATQVNHPTLGSLLFCRIAAHKIAVYLANIQELCARDS
ncbi:hypothetical protein XPA_006377 [Xanthoria parietina]